MEDKDHFIPPDARPEVNNSLLKNAWEMAYFLDLFLKENCSPGQSFNMLKIIDDDLDTGTEG